MSTGEVQTMVFAAPGRYVQGRGAVASLAEELENLGAKKPLILCDPIAGEVIPSETLDVPGAVRLTFNGECSPGEIDRVAKEAADQGTDAIVGVGGGKTMDTAKSVAHPSGLPLIIVPTIASTDAPTSAVAVVYEDDGSFKEYRFFGKNPNVVLVDTAVIASAPVRFLVAGIGDGLATYFEADTSSKTKKVAMAGGAPLSAALTLARLCYDTLLEHGLAARLAVERDIVTPAVEKVVEANTLLSGLGFESGGLAAAHSIHNGLTALDETHHYWHGEKVAFGVLAMLVLEGQPAEIIEEYTDFCLTVGLPVTLSDIGLDGVGREDLQKVADLACIEGETIHNEPFNIYPYMVVDAIVAADAFGRDRRSFVEGEGKLPVVAK